MDEFEKVLLEKIDKGEKLNESEIQDLIEYEFERKHGENRRWTRTVTSIIELGDRYFSINWEEGLTEYQENMYYNQPIEVEKKNLSKNNYGNRMDSKGEIT